LAKIAVASERGTNGRPAARRLAGGHGWTVSDVVCTSGPLSRPFEERHANPAIALVVAGTFEYRSGAGRELMTPGSALLANLGQYFECGHEHGIGDRCVSISYAPDFFERLAADAGGWSGERGFRGLRLPPVRGLSPMVARASAALAGPLAPCWEEFAIKLAARAVQLDGGLAPKPAAPANAAARVTGIVRMLEAHPEDAHDLAGLARAARLSPYHFLRTFESLTGVTPHQYLLRLRLRGAAVRLVAERSRILDIALDCGFGDVSNFNRTFRAEFGASPRAYRLSITR
jgi:AraC-like DNA-binding protein